MGRALLIILSGMTIAFSYLHISARNRANTGIKVNSTYAVASQSSNYKFAAMELAAKDISNDEQWRETYGNPATLTYSFGEYSTTVIVDDLVDKAGTKDTLRFRSKSSFKADTNSIVMLVTGEYAASYPPVNSAFAIEPPNIDYKVSGLAFNVNGNDTNFDGTAGPGAPVPGISVRSEDAKNSMLSTMTADQMALITGSTGAPSIEPEPSLADQDFTDWINKYVNEADTVVTGDTGVDTAFGTDDNPQITVMDGDIKMNANITGSGILIVTENTKLNIKGSFVWHGLVIQQGDAVTMGADSTTEGELNTKLNADMHIYGGTIIDSPANMSSLKLNMKENININYSTQGLSMVDKIFEQKGFEGGFELISLYQ